MRKLLDELAANPAAAKLWYDSSSGELIDPSGPSTTSAGVSMVTRTSVPHFADVLRDQKVDALVRITTVTPVSDFGHLVALGPDGFFLCTCMRPLVYGLLCPHGIKAFQDQGVDRFSGATISQRWRESETPWPMAALAAKPARLSAGAAESVGLPPTFSQPPGGDPTSIASPAPGPNVPAYAYANGVALGKELGGMFKAITSLAGIQRSMETIKNFARQQIDVEVRSQRDQSTTRVFRGAFSQPADGLPPGGGGGADTGGAGRGGTGATSRGRGRGGRGGRGGGGRGGRGGGSRDGRGEGGGDPTTGAPGPVAGVPVPNPPAAASGAAHVTLEGPPVDRVRTRQGGGVPLRSLTNATVPPGAGGEASPLLAPLEQLQAPLVARHTGRSKRHKNATAGGR